MIDEMGRARPSSESALGLGEHLIEYGSEGADVSTAIGILAFELL